MFSQSSGVWHLKLTLELKLKKKGEHKKSRLEGTWGKGNEMQRIMKD